ncbi:MAG: hypothetical protein ACO2PO_20260 [Candidatus Calescibacterium sp.]
MAEKIKMEINELWLKQVVRDFLKTGLLQRKIKELVYRDKDEAFKEFMKFYFELADYVKINDEESFRMIYEAPINKRRKTKSTTGTQTRTDQT